MADLSDTGLQALLRRNCERGWRAFIDQYTPTLLALIERAGVMGSDDQTEVYVRVCERLAENQCARLRRHDPSKGALAAWLTAVVHHTTVDWVRSQAGRRRLFKAIERLGEFDQRVFELTYWEGYRASEIAALLGQARDRPVALADVLDARARIEASLADRQRRQLLALMARSRHWLPLDADLDRPPPALVDRAPDPETALRVKRLERALGEALAELEDEEGAIVRLLFVHGWALHEVRRALHLKQEELSRERVGQILARLRTKLEARGIGPGDAATPGLAFLEGEST